MITNFAGDFALSPFSLYGTILMQRSREKLQQALYCTGKSQCMQRVSYHVQDGYDGAIKACNLILGSENYPELYLTTKWTSIGVSLASNVVSERFAVARHILLALGNAKSF